MTHARQQDVISSAMEQMTSCVETKKKIRTIVQRFRQLNENERKRLTTNQITDILRRSLSEELGETDEAINEVVTMVVIRAMRPYDGMVMEPICSPTAADTRRDQRKKTVRSNRGARR